MVVGSFETQGAARRMTSSMLSANLTSIPRACVYALQPATTHAYCERVTEYHADGQCHYDSKSFPANTQTPTVTACTIPEESQSLETRSNSFVAQTDATKKASED